MALLSSALVACSVAAASLTATPQAPRTTAVAIGPSVDRPAQQVRDQAFTVDPAGFGDFIDLGAAIATVPARTLLILKPGAYPGVVINRKSVRIESEVQNGAQFTGPFVVENIDAGQQIYLSGLFFLDTLEIGSCTGEVSLFGCRDDPSGFTNLPAGWQYCNQPCVNCTPAFNFDCGCGITRHRIQSCDAVTLVDCDLNGRDGSSAGFDGPPGETALEVTSSTVAVYGGTYAGGAAGIAEISFHAYGGTGGDAIRAIGPTARVRTTGALLQGGAAGEHWAHPGCPGFPVATDNGATHIPGPADAASLVLQPLARPGTTVNYVVGAPSGATILLKVGKRRAWREFPASTGIFHIAAPFTTLPLGTMGPSGLLTGSLPAPWPSGLAGFETLELQVHAIFSGQDRFSEPRTLQVTAVM